MCYCKVDELREEFERVMNAKELTKYEKKFHLIEINNRLKKLMKTTIKRNEIPVVIYLN